MEGMETLDEVDRVQRCICVTRGTDDKVEHSFEARASLKVGTLLRSGKGFGTKLSGSMEGPVSRICSTLDFS